MNLHFSSLIPRGARLAMAVFGLWAGLGTEAPAQTSPMPVADRLTVTETVRGILGYARWPDESGPLRLCIMGNGPHGESLLSQGVGALARRGITTARMAEDADVSTQCDAVYMGQMEQPHWHAFFARLAGAPVLTICERSAMCSTGGMFCLDVNAATGGVPFEVNLDAVARSGVRVNPQVLRLGRRGVRGMS